MDLEVTYADGWDGGVIGRMTPDRARSRDRGGSPYVTLIHDGPRLVAQVRVSREADRIEVVAHDEEGRRSAQLDLRGGGEVMVVRMVEAWGYRTGSSDADATYRSVTYRRDGRCVTTHEPNGEGGGSYQTFGQATQPSVGRPMFGDWQEVIALAGISATSLNGATAADALPLGSGEPWRPKGPFAPGDLTKLFTNGAAVQVFEREAEIAVVAAGQLALPSGKLIVMDPGYLWPGDDSTPLDGQPVSVPPGTYPVDLAIADKTVAAARLTISERPVRRWEMALGPDQSLAELQDGHFAGFGVDTGTASFTDASVAYSLADAADEASASLDAYSAEVGEHAMVMWHSGFGDGAYPVWLGRDAAGDIAVVIADMLVVEGRDEFIGGP
ncbi:hypothetical protein NBCG_02709 [Nocardioidaceae bacterium Broad-1]|uniref:DUF4241 domain-containing protein n=1 Tax=Nocardioides luteus TaxID=1844 RepID=UPI00020284AD|nr:DUF4241 domain-containing protein [Nocardioides luteus]EGD42954.1 hypothetical protein NBCG_02709 [Nocardioidaceae bacterium Broad-1]MBG6096715.1 hypothetical protein [Nocardioides luteus]